MAVTRTAGELLADLRDRADLELMEERHTDERLLYYITQSLRGCQNELLRKGHTEHLTWGASSALPTTAADSGAESFLEVAYPDGVEIHGVDVLQTGGKWYGLDKLNLEDRRQFEHRIGEMPSSWLVQTLPRTASTPTAAVTAGIVQIYPASALGLTYRLIYLEPHPLLTKSAQVVYGFDGDWLEWVVWNAAIMALYKDDEMDPSQDQKAVRERALIEQRMGVHIVRSSKGPTVPRRASGGRHRRRV